MGLEITVVVDNQCAGEALHCEHGLSILVHGPWGNLLLDAGASGEVLRHNAAALGLDLAAIPTVVLSHGHMDHTGGLGALLERANGLRLYCHPQAFQGRYVESPGKPLRSIGSPFNADQLRAHRLNVVEVTGPMQISSGLILSGPIGGPRRQTEAFAVHQGDDLVADPFADELFVLARGSAGWVVLTGCCHRGLANTLHLARFLVHEEPIAAIVGGLHLRGSDTAELTDLVTMLGKYGHPALHPCHCTGQNAIDYLTANYPGPHHPVPAGTTLEF